jgi:hypothetical protein
MEMKYILMLVLLLLTGCNTLQDKMDEMNRLNCQPPDVSLCAGWQI